MGYRFQFITLAGWHALNLSMFELACAYRDDGMLGYSQLQQREFGQEARRLSCRPNTKPSSAPAISTRCKRRSPRANSSTGAMAGSTETEQFTRRRRDAWWRSARWPPR